VAQTVPLFSVHPLDWDLLSGGSAWWNETDPARIAKLQLFTREQVCPHDVFRVSLEQMLGRQISDFELSTNGGLKRLRQEFLGDSLPPTLDDIVGLLPWNDVVFGLNAIQPDGTLHAELEVRMDVQTGADLREFQRRAAEIERQGKRLASQERGRQGRLPRGSSGEPGSPGNTARGPEQDSNRTQRGRSQRK
jgi:hypothetical protein